MFMCDSYVGCDQEYDMELTVGGDADMGEEEGAVEEAGGDHKEAGKGGDDVEME